MATQDINIRLSLTDNVTAKLQKVNANIASFGRDLKKVSRDVSQIGNTMALAGTAITAPLILAAKTASEYSVPLAQAFNQLDNTFKNLQVSIGNSLVPILQKFADAISTVVDNFNALDPATRDSLVQFVAMTGAWLVGIGVALSLIGKLGSLIANLIIVGSVVWEGVAAFGAFAIANPIVLAIVAAVGALVFAMVKWHGVQVAVINTFEVLGRVAWAVLTFIKATIELIIYAVTKLVAFLVKAGEILPGKAGKWAKDTREALDDFAGTLDKAMDTDMSGIETQVKTIGGLISGKQGSWSQGIDTAVGKAKEFGKQIGNVANLFKTGDMSKNKSGKSVGSFWDGILVGFEKVRQEFADFHALGVKVAQDTANGMKNMFSTFFYDAFTGQLKKAKDYFVEFGNSLLKTFSNVLAQMVTNWLLFGDMFGQNKSGGLFGILRSLVGLGSGLGRGTITGGVGGTNTGMQMGVYGTPVPTWSPYHSGGIIRAHNGLAVDEVPIIAQTGERVLSRSQNKQYEAGMSGQTVQPILVIRAWDFSDIHKNRKQIEGIFIDSMRRNSPVRNAMKEYR